MGFSDLRTLLMPVCLDLMSGAANLSLILAFTNGSDLAGNGQG